MTDGWAALVGTGNKHTNCFGMTTRASFSCERRPPFPFLSPLQGGRGLGGSYMVKTYSVLRTPYLFIPSADLS